MLQQLQQLQQRYEVMPDRQVDRSGFRTRMRAAQFLVETGMMDVGAPRPAMGYRLADRSAPACSRVPSVRGARCEA